jgi:hypothetical protein
MVARRCLLQSILSDYLLRLVKHELTIRPVRHGISGDYPTETVLGKKITYNEQVAEPGFRDKFSGYPTIPSLKELREVASRGRRTSLIRVPYGGSQSNSREVSVYLNEYAKVVFGSTAPKFCSSAKRASQ